MAKRLNISASTVSRALRGKSEIKTSTREAVVKMAEQLQYQPNLVAQNLRNKKTRTLGVIVPDLVPHFFSTSISGIQNVAVEKEYKIMICQSNESLETEVSAIRMFSSHCVDGLLISLSAQTQRYEHLESLYARNFPIVLFDRYYDNKEVSKVTVNDYEGAFKATEHLIQQGCRRIAHLAGPEKLFIGKRRLRGYLDAMRAYQLPIDEEMIRHSSLSKADIVHHTNSLLELPEPIDGLFAINDSVAIEAMLVMKEKGVKMPEDIALVGFTNEPSSALINPSLTTITQPAFEIGQLAARTLIEQIETPEDFTPKTIVLDTELVVRNSSRKSLYQADN